MRSDFEVIVRKLPKEDAIIYPIADLHVGDPGCDERAWDFFVNGVANTKNAYVVLAGDLMNNATKSSVSNVYAETMRPAEQKRWLAEWLEPIRDRILCAVPGNHERRSLRDVDDDPLYDVMCKLDLEDIYRPNMAFLELELGEAHSQYRIGVTHGSGNGSKVGSGINKNEGFAHVIEGLDALITAHTHKGAVTKPQKLVFNTQTKRIDTRDFVVMTATAWNGYSDYALQKQLTPASNSIQKMRLSVNSGHREKRIEVIW